MITTKEIIKKLINGNELTINDRNKTAYINKYRNYIEIPYEIAQILYETGLLECDSGNWDTGDSHYYICNYIDQDELITKGYLKIWWLNKGIELSKSHQFSFYSELNSAFRTLLASEIRKEKLIQLKKLIYTT